MDKGSGWNGRLEFDKYQKGGGEQSKLDKTGFRVIRGVPMMLTVKGLMMMIFARYTSSPYSLTVKQN